MKKLLFGCFMLSSSLVFATPPTDMNSKWVCTTNASSGKETSDKAADDIMAKTSGAVVNSFDYAAKNCRDCTKITCKLQ